MGSLPRTAAESNTDLDRSSSQVGPDQIRTKGENPPVLSANSVHWPTRSRTVAHFLTQC